MTTTPARAGRLGRLLRRTIAVVVVLASLLILAAVLLAGRPLPAPAGLVERIETRANAALAGQARATIGGVSLQVGTDLVPRVVLTEVGIDTAEGLRLLRLPRLRLALHADALLSGRLEPRRVVLEQGAVSLARAEDGSFGLRIGGEAAFAAGTPAEVIDAIDRAFSGPVLGRIERVEASDLRLTLTDARRPGAGIAGTGRIVMAQDAATLTLGLAMQLAGAELGAATTELTFSSRKGSSAAAFGATVRNLTAGELAVQVPALAWLAALEAPISGSFRSTIAEDGSLGVLGGTLEIGRGALRPTEAVAPVRFDAARMAFRYDPAAGRMEFDEIAFDSRALRLAAQSKVFIETGPGGLPTAFVGQMRIDALETDPEGVFADPVVFSGGAVDLKLSLDPFAVRIGQAVLLDGERRIAATGRAAAEAAGWALALDLDVPRIGADRLIQLWPVALVPKTRDWLDKNVTTGELLDLKAALRIIPGQEPRLALGYDFEGANVRVVRSLPPVEQAAGYATIDGQVYTLVLERGQTVTERGGPVTLDGSVLKVPDITRKPAIGEVTLRTDSTIPAALALLDEPPFRFLQKAGRPVDLAEGRARAEAVITLPLIDRVPEEEIGYAVRAELLDLRSEVLVPGHLLTAERLVATATPDGGLAIAGPGNLSGVGFEARWHQPFGPDAPGSVLEGSVDLSPDFVRAFRLGLPDAAVAGRGRGDIRIDLPRDGPPRLLLTSDLNRVTLSLPEIGWAKPAATPGRLVVEGRLGAPAQLDRIEIEAPGLAASGTLGLNEDGTLDRLAFDAVDLGWFTGRAALVGQGGAPPRWEIGGGTADLRRLPDLGGGARAGGSVPVIDVRLDRLRLGETLALTGFRGRFGGAAAFTGQFAGAINGAEEVQGSLGPAANGRNAYAIRADDAGAVFRAAGIFSRGYGGALDLRIVEEEGQGRYSGEVRAGGMRVRDAPILAELLGLISVVGLLEQMGGEGILFQQVDGRFEIRPDRVILRDGRAVGASLGVSIQGIYDRQAELLDMEGVISPVYFVNALGQIVSRPGEGLFGFTYRLTGPAAAPRVAVNPLSILTPGPFREIFRGNAAREAE